MEYPIESERLNTEEALAVFPELFSYFNPSQLSSLERSYFFHVDQNNKLTMWMRREVRHLFNTRGKDRYWFWDEDLKELVPSPQND